MTKSTAKTIGYVNPEKSTITLQQKLFEIMTSITHIEKDGDNTFHKYKYASEYAIKASVRHELMKQRVLFQLDILEHTIESIDGQIYASIKTRYTFTDVDTGDILSGTFAGIGADKGDKGLYKAITGAIKYILTSTFLIPTGDDPEKDDRYASKEISDELQAEIDAITNTDDLKAYYLKNQSKGKAFTNAVTARKVEIDALTSES